MATVKELEKVIVQNQAEMAELREMVKALLESQKIVTVENPKVAVKKNAAWQGVIVRADKAGKDLVLSASYEKDWTWVMMSAAPSAEVSAEFHATGGKFSGRRKMWYWQSHVTPEAACGKFHRHFSAR